MAVNGSHRTMSTPTSNVSPYSSKPPPELPRKHPCAIYSVRSILNLFFLLVAFYEVLEFTETRLFPGKLQLGPKELAHPNNRNGSIHMPIMDKHE